MHEHVADAAVTHRDGVDTVCVLAERLQPPHEGCAHTLMVVWPKPSSARRPSHQQRTICCVLSRRALVKSAPSTTAPVRSERVSTARCRLALRRMASLMTALQCHHRRQRDAAAMAKLGSRPWLQCRVVPQHKPHLSMSVSDRLAPVKSAWYSTLFMK